LLQDSDQDQRRLNALVQAGFKSAKQPDKAMSVLEKKHFEHYSFKNPAGVLRETDKYGVDFRNVFDQTPLMIASRMGNAELAEALLDRDADTSLVDGNGLNAFEISLERACADERFARTKLPAVFERLAPASLDLQIDARLVKLDRRLMEYLTLCVAMVFFYHRLGLQHKLAQRSPYHGASDRESLLVDKRSSGSRRRSWMILWR